MKDFIKKTYGFFAVVMAMIIVFLIAYRDINKHNRFIINQRIVGYASHPELVTTIEYQFDILDIWSDPPSDSIKCIRYHQAKMLRDKYKHIQNLKCK